ncbi:MAG: hypothetical protein EOM20_11750 [Spartobacteria bacterium]|nr:hypothetical protein [Spartobacteria bacterium]
MPGHIGHDPRGGQVMTAEATLYSRDAEAALLGCILYDPGVGLDAALQHGITDDSFHKPDHRAVFSAALALWHESGAVDVVTLQSASGADAGLLERMLDGFSTVAFAPHYADRVKECERRRNLHRIGKRLQATATDAEDVNEAAQSAVTALVALSEPSTRIETLPDAADALGTAWDAVAAGEQLPGIPSRFDEINGFLGGYSEYTILAARPAQGKSTLMLNEVAAMLAQGYSVGVVSVEMTTRQCLGRMASEQADVNFFAVQQGYATPDQRNRAKEKARYLAGLNLHVTDRASTIEDVCSWCRMTHLRNRLDIIFIDYLQLIRGTHRYGNGNDKVQDFSSRLLYLRKRLGIPVVVLSQLSRECEKENRLPRLSDLRDSGAIEQDGHTILLLSHDPEHPDGPSVLQIAKNRDGATGQIRLERNFRRQRFEPARKE